MKNKLQEYALLAEIIGGIAIVASLIFVGIQINQNHDMMRAQTRSDISSQLSNLFSQIAESDYIETLHYQANISELSEKELLRASHFNNARLRIYENIFYQYKNGLYEESEFSVEKEAWRGVINEDMPAMAFCSGSQFYSEEFRVLLTDMMEFPCENSI